MLSSRRWIEAATIVSMFLAPSAFAQEFADEDVIEYRKHIMESLNAQSAMLGQIVSYSVPNDHVIQYLEALALLASTAHRAFEPEVPGGESRPEVWSNWDDFSQQMQEFARKTDAAVVNAKENGKESALVNILDVLSCKSCHDEYRDESQ